MPPTITPQELVAKWRGETRKERSVSQEHFIDLCRLLVHETPGENRISEVDILARLLALNLARAAAQGGAAAAAPADEADDE